MKVLILNRTSLNSENVVLGVYGGGHCWRFDVDRNNFFLFRALWSFWEMVV